MFLSWKAEKCLKTLLKTLGLCHVDVQCWWATCASQQLGSEWVVARGCAVLPGNMHCPSELMLVWFSPSCTLAATDSHKFPGTGSFRGTGSLCSGMRCIVSRKNIDLSNSGFALFMKCAFIDNFFN